MASNEVDDLGFIVEEDQSDQEMPSADAWQAQHNLELRSGWLQGHKSRTEYPEMRVDQNPYLLRDTADLRIVTRALGWEDGFVAAGDDVAIEDCPFPELG